MSRLVSDQPHQVRLAAWDESKKQLAARAKCRKEFFSLINSELEAGNTKDWGSFSDSDRYCYNLLKSFENKSTLQVAANLLSEDGQVVSFPLPVLSLAWPDLGKIVSGVLCCGSDIVVCVPCQGQTLLHLKELI